MLHGGTLKTLGFVKETRYRKTNTVRFHVCEGPSRGLFKETESTGEVPRAGDGESLFSGCGACMGGDRKVLGCRYL